MATALWDCEVSFEGGGRWWGPSRSRVRAGRPAAAARRVILAAKTWRKHDVVPEGTKIRTVIVKVVRVSPRRAVRADPRQLELGAS